MHRTAARSEDTGLGLAQSMCCPPVESTCVCVFPQFCKVMRESCFGTRARAHTDNLRLLQTDPTWHNNMPSDNWSMAEQEQFRDTVVEQKGAKHERTNSFDPSGASGGTLEPYVAS